jgi:hypothetical protein
MTVDYSHHSLALGRRLFGREPKDLQKNVKHFSQCKSEVQVHPSIENILKIG